MKKYGNRRAMGERTPVIVDGARSAFVKSFGVFQNCDSLELYSRVVDGLIRKVDVDPNAIDELSCGVVIPQTKNTNVARDTVINLGLPPHIHGYTLNRACTSSLHTVADAVKSISFGQHDVILAGGVECLSDVPIVYSRAARKFLLSLSKSRTTSAKMKTISTFSPKDWVPSPPGLSEPLTGFTMGEHAEMMAKINGISREDQDQFALRSHRNAASAHKAQKFSDEIVTIWSPPNYNQHIDADNLVREDTNLESLSKIRPAFDRKYGSITAGNASALTDGAAVTMIADQQRAKELGLTPKAKVKDFCFVGVQPHPQLLLGPAIAIPLLLKQNNLTLDDIDLFEIHEAFAAQVLSCIKLMDSKDFMEQHFGDSSAFGLVPDNKLNINGGAIALGHPFGATGSRLITTMTQELHRSDKNLGVIAICAAGGMAAAMLIERI